MHTKIPGPPLSMDVDAFTLRSLFRKAAAHKGLTLAEESERAYTETIKKYALNGKLLGVLAGHGIKRQMRPDCHDNIFTLVDEGPQEHVSGWSPSNYWNFKRNEKTQAFNLRVTLYADLGLSVQKRGIIIVPKTSSTLAWAADPMPNWRMFKALTDADASAPPIAKELAASSDGLLVSWTALGLGGIRSLATLFAEFSHGNESVEWLAQHGQVFAPAPYSQSGDTLYIAEPAQPSVFAAWREQLQNFRNTLVV